MATPDLKLIRSDHRIIIEIPCFYPGSGHHKSEGHLRSEVDRIRAEILRHVDLEGSELRDESKLVCPHCWDAPEVDQFGPNCCRELIADWKAQGGAIDPEEA